MTSGVKNVYKRYSDAGPGPEVQAYWHFMAFFDILWYFGTFFSPIFSLFPTFRLSDSTALIEIHVFGMAKKKNSLKLYIS